MKKDNKYEIAVFEDNDKADLVEYSKQMQESIEKALDNNKGEKGEKGEKGDKGELVELINEAEGKSISIESAPAKMREIKIEGETIQKTRSGKNKFNINIVTSTSTLTNNGDGTLTTTTLYNQLSQTLKELAPDLKVGDSVKIVFKTNGENYIYLVTSKVLWRNGTARTITEDDLNGVIAFYGKNTTGTTYTISDVMILNATETDLNYEPYGASPSPDYISKIENLEGKNKFNYLWFDTTKEVDWTAYQSISSVAKAIPMFIGKGNVVTFSSNVPLLSSDNLLFAINDLTKGSSAVFALGKTQTIKANNEGYVYVGYIKSRTNYDKVKDGTYYVQVEEGTVATPYAPYNSLEFKDVGSNVLELSKGTVTLNGVTLTSDGETITINGTVSDNYPVVKLTNGLKTAISLEALVSNYISEKVAQLEDIEDYTMQSIISGGSSTFTPYIASYNKTVRELWYGIGTPAKTIQTSSTSLIAIYLGGKGSTYNNYKIKIGINKGTVVKPYEPYKQQTEYFPLSEGQKLMEGSYLADDGIHHVRKQVVLTGTENWNLYSNKTKTFKLSISPWSYSGVCTHYQGITSSSFDVKAGIYLSGSAMVIISDPRFSTVEEFKTYLAEQYSAGTPVTLEYIMMTNNSKTVEEIVPYTETQKEARNKIKNMILFKGTNHISCTGKVKIKYYTNEEMNEIYAYKEELHEHENKKILDQTQESFTTELKNKLEELNNYVLPPATNTTLGGVKAGSNTTIGDDGAINANLDYNELSNKPKIAGIDLQGNKSLDDLGIQAKEEGKGLSTENYSSKEKTKLAGIETGANKYVHPTTSGNKHIPGGGSSGQVLKWQSDGTAKWDSLSSSGELGTQDLNTIKTSGIYIQSTSTNFLKSKNYPFDYAEGFPFFDILLEVLNVGTYIMQKLHITYKISVNGQDVSTYLTYMRFSTDGGTTWKNWRGHEGVNTSI